MERFAIVARDDSESIELALNTKNKFIEKGLTFDEENPDIVCIIGGDGTFLSAIHKYIHKLDKVVFSGINTGTLGFFADYTLDEIDQFIDHVVEKEPEIEYKKMLKISVEGERNRTYYAVNEMRVENIIRTQTIDVFINDEKLETYRGTGLCVCTQVGSTAYNRSLKGAVIEVGLDVIELTEVTGIHHVHYRSLGAPMVLNGSNRIRMVSNYDETSLLCFDRYAINLKGATSIECTLSDKQFRLAHYRPTKYIHHLFHLFQ